MEEVKFHKEDVVIFTVCNIAYLHKAMVLADSLFLNTDFRLNIFLFDKKQELNLDQENCVIHWMEDMNIQNYLHLAFKYDIIEFSTSLKPYITLELLKKHNKVIFFDPDIFIYKSIECIISELNNTSILLTPHYIVPQTNDFSESDTAMMRFGSFNLGFFAIRNTQQSHFFLNWWSDRCINLCYMESQLGLSTDQKWVTIAPCFFEDIKISFNMGYNVAPWNTSERIINFEDDKSILINKKHPLIFFHFSNFNETDPGYLHARSLREYGLFREDLFILGTKYANDLKSKSTKYKNLNKVLYSYDYMSNGYYITPLLRLAYSSMYNTFNQNHNPYDSSGEIAKFALKNGLLKKNLKPLGYLKNKLNMKDSFSLEIKTMNIFLRVLLYFVGPLKFHIFCRGLVFFSSPRINKALWKS